MNSLRKIAVSAFATLQVSAVSPANAQNKIEPVQPSVSGASLIEECAYVTSLASLMTGSADPDLEKASDVFQRVLISLNGEKSASESFKKRAEALNALSLDERALYVSLTVVKCVDFYQEIIQNPPVEEEQPGTKPTPAPPVYNGKRNYSLS